MLLNEIKDSFFEIDNSRTFFSYGRKLVEEEIPENEEVLLLLDPLFLTILTDNLRKVIASGKKKVSILLIPFDNMELRFVETYINQLEDMIPEIADSNIEIEFLTPSNIEVTYLDKTYFKLGNPLFVKVINLFEKEYIERIDIYRSHR